MLQLAAANRTKEIMNMIIFGPILLLITLHTHFLTAAVIRIKEDVTLTPNPPETLPNNTNDTDIPLNTEAPFTNPADSTISVSVTVVNPPTVENRSTTGPVIMHRYPPQLEEKIASLGCDVPLLPDDSRVWNGNETHELLLPITVCSLVLFSYVLFCRLCLGDIYFTKRYKSTF